MVSCVFGMARMPPKGKLADRQIEILEPWMKLGAPWPGTNTPVVPTAGQFAITEKQRPFWSFQLALSLTGVAADTHIKNSSAGE
jgi:hypothetical protein